MSKPIGRPFACLAGALLLALAPSLAHAFDLQGHRGARGLMPENTLPAFAHALSLGVDTLELDLGMTKDGVLVVAHDPAPLPKLTRYQGAFLAETAPPIWHMSYKELKKYDVGRINPDDPTYKQFSRQQPMDGLVMPRLSDVFELTRRSGNETVRFNIEIKISPLEPDQTASPDAFTSATVKAIREAGLAGRANIQSFDWRVLQISQKLAPEIPTAYLSSGRTLQPGSPWLAGFELKDHGGSAPRMVKAAGGAIWSPFFRNMTDDDIRTARELGIKVIVWTVNEKRDMKALIERGVDGIITDYPDLLREVMAELGMPLPKPTPVVP
ncbi:MAG: glycerophosphodiester phosphodiesterase [Alphaproteobacteria bacterium]|nr:glycerophosphodiester phosphodiesterase [Alphaproteobacteria bacterium]